MGQVPSGYGISSDLPPTPGLPPIVGGPALASPSVGGGAPVTQAVQAAVGGAPGPAVGGATHAGIPAGAVKGWSVDDMVQYMSAIDLGHLAPAMQENGMDGRFLLECTQEDFLAIGVTALLWKKIHSRLPK